jgi:hypothetical protein
MAAGVVVATRAAREGRATDLSCSTTPPPVLYDDIDVACLSPLPDLLGESFEE